MSTTVVPAQAAQSSPAPAATSSPSASPAASATVSPDKKGALEQTARSWWDAFAGGKLDRTQLTPAMDKAMTGDLVAKVSAQLKSAGTPSVFNLKQSKVINGDNLYVFAVTLPAAKVDEVIALSPDGKLDGIYFRPAASP